MFHQSPYLNLSIDKGASSIYDSDHPCGAKIGGLGMALPDGLSAVTGAQQLHDWFGYWPSIPANRTAMHRQTLTVDHLVDPANPQGTGF
jgi:hypothetical protein